MPQSSLLKCVQDYLDAELMLERRRSESGSTAPQERHFDEASKRLEGALNVEPRGGENEELVATARAYIESVTAFHAARDTHQNLGLPARQMERAQRELQRALYCAVRPADTRGHSYPKRFLVAVDDSDAAGWALKTAVAMADESPATIKLVHVIQLPIDDPYQREYYVNGIEERIRRAAEEQLRRMKAEVPACLDCETTICEGDTAVEVAALARRWGADFVFVGTRGRGRLTRFLMGSTAEAVIRLTHCPVITVGADPANAPADRDDVVSASSRVLSI